MNECPNAILRDFDDYLMDDASHVVANNDDNVVYNDQLYCAVTYCNKNFDATNYSNNIFIAIKYF